MDIVHDATRPADAGPAYGFGLSMPGIATILRKLADQIENGECVGQDVRLIQRATVDDFAMQTLLVRFAEKQK